MSLTEHHQRNAAVKRILAVHHTGFSAAATASITSILHSLDTDMLESIDLHHRENLDYYPDLLGKVCNAEPEDRRGQLQRINHLVSVAKQVVPVIPKRSDFRGEDTSGEPMPNVEPESAITGLLDLLPVPAGTTITPDQDEALLRTAMLIARHDSYNVRLAGLIEDLDHYTLTAGFAKQVMDSTDDPVTTAHRVMDKVSRLAFVESLLREPLAHQNMLDYPDNLLDGLARTKKADLKTYRMVRDLMTKGASAQSVIEAISYFPFMSGLGEMLATGVMRAARTYEGINTEQRIALITVTAALLCIPKAEDHSVRTSNHPDLGPMHMIVDDRFVRLLLEKPNLSDAIVQAISERQTSDFELITNVVDNVAPALGEGFL